MLVKIKHCVFFSLHEYQVELIELKKTKQKNKELIGVRYSGFVLLPFTLPETCIHASPYADQFLQ